MSLQKMIYRPRHNEGGLESGSSDHHVPGTPPPEYDSTHMEYPPDYQDALKDIILSTGMYMHKHTCVSGSSKIHDIHRITWVWLAPTGYYMY